MVLLLPMVRFLPESGEWPPQKSLWEGSITPLSIITDTFPVFVTLRAALLLMDFFQ